MKEFAFLRKECGFADALFYFFYKIDLKIRMSPFFKQRREQKLVRLERINLALALYEGEKITINHKIYLKQSFAGPANGVVYLRPGSSDLKVYQQIINHQEYKGVVDMYRQLFSASPAVIFDCGANIGLASIYFNSFFPGAKFTVIEPFKENSELIRLNFERNGLQNFILLEGGIWNCDTMLTIDREFRDGKEWSISLTDKGASKDIPAYSIAALIEKAGQAVDILKIDIEGAEKILFKEKEYAKDFLRNVKCLAIEIHDEFDTRDEIYAALSESNFIYYSTHEFKIGLNLNYISKN